MTLKKINPEDLVVGKECYVKMKVVELDGSDVPICLEDNTGNGTWFHKDQPIYTIEQTETDTDLEMLLNVASRLYAPNLDITIGNAEIITGKKHPTSNSKENMDYWIEVNAKLATLTAQTLITACKNALKEVSND